MRSPAAVLVGFAVIVAFTPSRRPAPVVAAGAQETPLPLRILDSGFAIAEPFPDEDPATTPRRVTVALVIENPNPDLAAEGLILDLRLLDPSGRLLAPIRVAVAQLLPEERRNVVTHVNRDPTQTVAAVDASVAQFLRWRRVEMVPLPAVQLARPPAGINTTWRGRCRKRRLPPLLRAVRCWRDRTVAAGARAARAGRRPGPRPVPHRLALAPHLPRRPPSPIPTTFNLNWHKA